MDGLCITCLCSGDLNSINDTELINIYSQILNVPVADLSVNIRVCRDCQSLLHKFQKFKDQAQTCYKEMLSWIKQNANDTNRTIEAIKNAPHLEINHISNDELISTFEDTPTKISLDSSYNTQRDQMDSSYDGISFVQVKIEIVDNDPESSFSKDEDNTDIDWKRKGKKEIDQEEKHKAVQFISRTESTHKKHDSNLMKSRSSNKIKKKKIPKFLLCDHCKFQTTKRDTLVLHLYSHHNKSKIIHCHHCDYKTEYLTALTLHNKIKHQIDTIPEQYKQIYKCKQCKFTACSKKLISIHDRQKHDVEIIYQCSNCSYSTDYKFNYLKHIKIHREGIFKCDKCPFVTKFEGHMTRHLAKIHNEVLDNAYHCTMCDFVTRDVWRLNVHKQKSNKGIILSCDICDYETMYNCDLKTHRIEHSNVNVREKESDIRGMEINKTNINLRTNSNADISCNEPHESINNVKNLMVTSIPELDYGNKPVPDKDKPHSCPMCSFASKFKPALKRHIQRHHSGSQNLPYQCTNCDFSTKTKEQITLHNKRSISDKILTCKSCDFTTLFKCTQTLHQKSHHAFKCDICSYSCRHKHEMEKHYDVHSGIFLRCPLCDFVTNRKDSLAYHETTHTGNKPYKCTLCSYMSVRKYLLDTHIKRHHGIIKKDVVIINTSKINSLRVKEGNSSKF